MEKLEHKIRALERRLLRVQGNGVVRVYKPPIPMSLYCETPVKGIVGRLFIPFDCELRRLYVHIDEMFDLKYVELTMMVASGYGNETRIVVVSADHIISDAIHLREGSRVMFRLSENDAAKVSGIWIALLLFADDRVYAKRLEVGHENL